ncbi:ExbD/TolR family protein [Isoalcanivorax indicus]|uniref:ExbD/TolR family protein n=1 Tax=Isoalcanivorax indicus TaxID=2202653 RepID=UPI000DBA9903|nr:biopolymer transporter ExbD [Isoalcanivorax indicus]
MKNTRRLRRLARVGQRPAASLSLTSLMDIFTILLLYLLVNQSDNPVLDPPREIVLPNSIVETKPRETVVVAVSPDEVLIRGEHVMSMQALLESEGSIIEAIRDRMQSIGEGALGLGDDDLDGTEVTILADQDVHYSTMKRIMASCTAAGYNRISLAVNQI